MFITKVFLPLSSPGLAAMGLGVLSVVSGPINAIEIAAILVGLSVVAVAGVFTIRSNVAKIWREQAEGEKARNEALVEKSAETLKAHADQLATQRVEFEGLLAESRRDIEAERHAKDQALLELSAAHSRTDLTPIVERLDRMIGAQKGTA